jgi:hypothetical protein
MFWGKTGRLCDFFAVVLEGWNRFLAVAFFSLNTPGLF